MWDDTVRSVAAHRSRDDRLRQAGLRLSRNMTGLIIVPSVEADQRADPRQARIPYLTNLNDGDLARRDQAMTSTRRVERRCEYCQRQYHAAPLHPRPASPPSTTTRCESATPQSPPSGPEPPARFTSTRSPGEFNSPGSFAFNHAFVTDPDLLQSHVVRLQNARHPLQSDVTLRQLQPLVEPQLGQAWQAPARCIWTPHCMHMGASDL